MVEGARLERVYRGNSIEGSNPSLTAIISIYYIEIIELFRNFNFCSHFCSHRNSGAALAPVGPRPQRAYFSRIAFSTAAPRGPYMNRPDTQTMGSDLSAIPTRTVLSLLRR